MRFLTLLILMSLFGCVSRNDGMVPDEGRASPATYERKLNFNYEEFLNSLDSTNQKLRGELFRANMHDLHSLDKDKYMTALSAYNSSNAKIAKAGLENFEVMSIRGYKKTFVQCGYSASLGISFCDDPMCMNIEKVERSTLDKTADLRKDLPLKSCN